MTLIRPDSRPKSRVTPSANNLRPLHAVSFFITTGSGMDYYTISSRFPEIFSRLSALSASYLSTKAFTSAASYFSFFIRAS